MEGWNEALTQLEDAATWIDEHVSDVTRSEAGELATRLREANRRIWRLVHQFEASDVEHIYDTHALIKAMAKAADDVGDISNVWLKLIETGALKIQGRRLLSAATSLGVNVHDYVDIPKEDEDDV